MNPCCEPPTWRSSLPATTARQAGFRVSEFDFDEVRSLDAGSWFVAEDGPARSARAFGSLARLDPADLAHYRSGRVVIPTLSEALLFTKEHDWLVNVEIKSFPERPRRLGRAGAPGHRETRRSPIRC